MTDINKYRIAVVVLTVAVLALIIALVAQNDWDTASKPENAQSASSTAATATTTQTTSTNKAAGSVGTGGAAAGNVAGNSAGGGTKPSGSIFTIYLTAPAGNPTWTIGGQNVISWSHAAGVTGEIELLDASTYKLAGVINPELGPNQTSYAWNTRDLLLSRTNPLKTTVTPGTYLVRIAFDGNGLSPLTSGSVTILQ